MPPINQLQLLLSYQRVLAWETKFSNIQWRCLLFILTGERGKGVVAWGKDHKPYSSSSPLHFPGLSASSHCTALSGAVPCTQKYIQVFLKSLSHSYDFFKVFFPPLYPALQVTVVWCSQWGCLGGHGQPGWFMPLFTCLDPPWPLSSTWSSYLCTSPPELLLFWSIKTLLPHSLSLLITLGPLSALGRYSFP